MHRSGRTGRAGNTGTVVCLVPEEQRGEVRALQRELGFTAELTAPFEAPAVAVPDRPANGSKVETAVRTKNPERAARHKATASRLNGTVKFFDAKRGYGFLAAPDGSDVFVHHSKLDDRGSGRPFLRKGDRVVFEVAPGRRGQEARNVKVSQSVAS